MSGFDNCEWQVRICDLERAIGVDGDEWKINAHFNESYLLVWREDSTNGNRLAIITAIYFCA